MSGDDVLLIGDRLGDALQLGDARQRQEGRRQRSLRDDPGRDQRGDRSELGRLGDSGTYASFTIGATAPSNLRILGDDAAGPINISTRRSRSRSERAGLERDRAQQPHDRERGDGAERHRDHELRLPGRARRARRLVRRDPHRDLGLGAPSAAIQRCDIQGGTGLVREQRLLRRDQPGLAELARLDRLDDRDLDADPGIGQRVARRRRSSRAPGSCRTSTCRSSSVSRSRRRCSSTRFPNAPFIIVASPRLGFQTAAAAVRDAVPPRPGRARRASVDVHGRPRPRRVGFEVAPIAALLGFSFTVQVVVGDPGHRHPPPLQRRVDGLHPVRRCTPWGASAHRNPRGTRGRHAS